MQKNRILAAAIASTLTSAAHAATPAEHLNQATGRDVMEPATDAELEAKIEAKGLTAPRLTNELIQSLIVDEIYTRIDGTNVTICTLTLANGHKVVGVNEGPVSAANFDQEIGCELAYKHAVDQVWPLEGYLLRERLFRAAVEDEKVGKLRDLVAVQSAPGNVDASEYHRGMANGLVLALSVFTGQDPAFHEAPATTHRERVVKEHAELGERIGKLEDFMNGEIYATLDVAERMRLLDQHAAMLAYSVALSARIAAFPA
jgi:hypothetical protein